MSFDTNKFPDETNMDEKIRTRLGNYTIEKLEINI